jgi:hypothetical protein
MMRKAAAACVVAGAVICIPFLRAGAVGVAKAGGAMWDKAEDVSGVRLTHKEKLLADLESRIDGRCVQVARKFLRD